MAGTIKIKILGDSSSFNQSVEQAESKLGGFSSGMQGIFQGIGQSVGQGLAQVPSQIGGFLNSAVGAASDLNESQSKVGVVFGDSAKQIEDWAKTAATSMGQSRQQALEAAGTFGNLFTAMGIGQKPAADMSKSLVGLAGDLASFNNVSPEEALLALRSGLTGETEPLRKFGINLNEATLKQKAMEMGLSDGKGTLDANAKAQAAYALILEQSKTAQGDFARTSGGLANQQRILSAKFQDVKASIGQALLPVMQGFVSFATGTLIPAITSITRFLSEHKEMLLAVGAGILAALVPAFIAWAAAAIPAAAATLAAAAPVIALGVVIGGLVLAVIEIVKHFDIFKSAGETAFNFVKDVATTVWNWISENWPLLLAILTGPIGAAVLVIVKHWDTIKDGISAVKDWISDRVDDIVGFFTGLPGRITGLISTFTDAGKSLAKAVLDGIAAGFSATVGFVGDVGSALFDAFKGAANHVIDMINDALPNELGFGPFKINLPDNPIPRLAGGGVIMGPTVALLGEYPGARSNPEIAAPESKIRQIIREEVGAGGGNTYNIELRNVWGDQRSAVLQLRQELRNLERGER